MKKIPTKTQIDQLVPHLKADFKKQKEGISQFIKKQRKSLEALIKNPDVGGFEICRYNTAIFDVVVQKIYEIAVEKVGIEPNIAIFAAGGYGRRELCYLSDIDLCYTSDVDLEEVYDENTLRFIRVFYDFIDSFHTPGDLIPRISFIYRPYCDVPEWDYIDLTALLDARFLAGNPDLMDGLRDTIRSEIDDISAGSDGRLRLTVIIQLLASRDEHIKKTGGSIYMNQPDIKSGSGGLRDIQFALWMKGIKDFAPIAKMYEENMVSAIDFILKARNLLHFTASKFTDVLSYNPEKQDYTQLKIAKLMGYEGTDEEKVYALMSDYYGHAKYLHLKSELIISKILETGIKISNHLAAKEYKIYCIDDEFEKLTEAELLAIFEYFQQYDFEIDANLGDYLASNHQRFNVEGLKKRFINLFSLGGRVSKAIRRMHRLGIIEHFLPELERSIRIPSERPTDPYTVGKHLMEAVANLDDIRNAEEKEVPIKPTGILGDAIPQIVEPASGTSRRRRGSNARLRLGEAHQRLLTEIKFLHEIYLQIADPSALYFALLMHDFDKPNKNHAVTGSKKIDKIAASLGFNQVQIEEIAFLIKEHLTMIDIARYHPLNDVVVDHFAKSVGSLDRLNKLYLLTYCDSKANGAHNFSAVDKDSLRRLYELTRERFVGKDDSALYASVSPERINRFLSQMPVTYRMSHGDINEIIFHLRLVEMVEKSLYEDAETPPVIVEFIDKIGYTELHFCCPDKVGLINQITGAFYAYDIDVREASIYTKEDTSIALDTFKLVYKPRALRETQPSPLGEKLKTEIKRVITELINGNISLDAIFEHRGVKEPDDLRIFNISVEGGKVEHPEEVREEYSEIVVAAADRNGFLYLFSGILADLGLNIEMSKCSTLGGTVTNRFYVTPIERPQEIEKEIVERLKPYCQNS